MRSEVDELKRFAIADILSVSGKQKTTETINMHINTIIDIAFLKGQQAQQSKVDELTKQRDSFIKAYEIEMDTSLELQKRVDAALQLVNEMKGKRYPFSAYADQLEQALKGGCDE